MKQLLTLLLATLFTLGLHADCPNSSIYIGGNYTRSHIKPHALPSFEGNMGGAQAGYQYRPLDSIFVAIGTAWRSGSNHGSSGTRSLLDVDVHEWIGYTAAFKCNRFLLTPFTGLGFRHLSHHLKPKSGSSMKLRYNEFYIPLGLLTEFQIVECFSMGVHAVWMPQVYPTLTINVIDGARWAIKNTYKNFNIGVPLIINIKRVHYLSIILKPYFELWQDGRTKAKTSFGERLALPKNTYTFWGVNLNFNFTF
ncbi:MAG: hypothetical protein K1060chlam2_00468 [Chlamydiae bacterium]|nr:hypothetical protein [Chlamydiota bacterium]